MKRQRHGADVFARWTPGLLAVGCCLWGHPVPQGSAGGEKTERTPEPDGRLPSGHPERLAAHIPLTNMERELWSALNLRA